ncbi:MAG: hypothetical protein HOM96_04645 [Rickettsiales bacterium]|nr:hypothetical protein [Rickettsiales bacterium]
MNKEQFLQALKKSFTKDFLSKPFVISRWKKSDRGNEKVIDSITDELFPDDLTPVTYDSLKLKLKDGLGLTNVPSSTLGGYYQYLYIASLLPEGDTYFDYDSEATKLNVFNNLYLNLKGINAGLSQEGLDSDVREVIGAKKRLQRDHYILFCLHQLCEKIGNIYIPPIFNKNFDIIEDDSKRKACYKFLIYGLEISKSINQAENLLSTQLTAEDKPKLANFKKRNKDKSTTEEKSVLYKEVLLFIADKQALPLPPPVINPQQDGNNGVHTTPPPPPTEMERQQQALAELKTEATGKIDTLGKLIVEFETGINRLQALQNGVLAFGGNARRVSSGNEDALSKEIQRSITSFKEALTNANDEQIKLGRFIQDNVTGTATTTKSLKRLADGVKLDFLHHATAMQEITAQTQQLTKAISNFNEQFTVLKKAAAAKKEEVLKAKDQAAKEESKLKVQITDLKTNILVIQEGCQVKFKKCNEALQALQALQATASGRGGVNLDFTRLAVEIGKARAGFNLSFINVQEELKTLAAADKEIKRATAQASTSTTAGNEIKGLTVKRNSYSQLLTAYQMHEKTIGVLTTEIKATQTGVNKRLKALQEEQIRQVEERKAYDEGKEGYSGRDHRNSTEDGSEIHSVIDEFSPIRDDFSYVRNRNSSVSTFPTNRADGNEFSPRRIVPEYNPQLQEKINGVLQRLGDQNGELARQANGLEELIRNLDRLSNEIHIFYNTPTNQDIRIQNTANNLWQRAESIKREVEIKLDETYKFSGQIDEDINPSRRRGALSQTELEGLNRLNQQAENLFQDNQHYLQTTDQKIEDLDYQFKALNSKAALLASSTDLHGLRRGAFTQVSPAQQGGQNVVPSSTTAQNVQNGVHTQQAPTVVNNPLATPVVSTQHGVQNVVQNVVPSSTIAQNGPSGGNTPPTPIALTAFDLNVFLALHSNPTGFDKGQFLADLPKAIKDLDKNNDEKLYHTLINIYDTNFVDDQNYSHIYKDAGEEYTNFLENFINYNYHCNGNDQTRLFNFISNYKGNPDLYYEKLDNLIDLVTDHSDYSKIVLSQKESFVAYFKLAVVNNDLADAKNRYDKIEGKSQEKFDKYFAKHVSEKIFNEYSSANRDESVTTSLDTTKKESHKNIEELSDVMPRKNNGNYLEKPKTISNKEAAATATATVAATSLVVFAATAATIATAGAGVIALLVVAAACKTYNMHADHVYNTQEKPVSNIQER